MSHHGAASLEQSDTTPRAMQRSLERVRATSPRARLEQVRAATMSDVRKQHPGASRDELAIAFLRRVYGDVIADRFAARHPAR